MLIRLVCAALLSLAALSSHAVVTVYEFEGYIAEDSAQEDLTLPNAQFPLAGRISGSFTVDTERTTWDPEEAEYRADPITEFTVNTLAGGSLSVSSTEISSLQAFRARLTNTEAASIGMHGYIHSTSGTHFGSASLSWAAPPSGQTPSDGVSTDFDPAALSPNEWELTVNTLDPDAEHCAPDCDEGGGSIRARVTLWRQGGEAAHYATDFDSAPAGWQTFGGNWVVEGGVYRNLANVNFTSSVYALRATGSEYDVRARLYTQWSATGNTLGLVLNYFDNQNYDEVRFNAAGTATISRIRAGGRRTLATASYQGAARTWFDVHVRREGHQVTVWTNDVQIFDVDAGQPIGDVAGVFASWNQARFDDFSIFLRNYFLTSTSEFSSSPALGWYAQGGDWSVVDGYYLSSSNLPAAISTHTANVGDAYSIDASLYMDWSNRGNRAGFVYDYVSPSNYRAVLFNAAVWTGEHYGQFGSFEVIEVRNGVRRVVYALDPAVNTLIPSKHWYGVGIRRNQEMTKISLGSFSVALTQSIVTGTKYAGLIASYNRVRFDDVVLAPQ